MKRNVLRVSFGACFMFLLLVGGAVAQADPTPPPEIDIRVTSHDYGDVQVGDSEDWILKIANRGLGLLWIYNVTSNHPDFEITSPGTFPQTVNYSGGLFPDSLFVTVTFTPTTAGAIAGTLTVSSNDFDEGTLYVFLTGRGVITGPLIEVSATDHDFGDVAVGGSSDWILTVFNSGTEQLIISDVSSDNPDFAPYPTFFAVDPGDSQAVTITFSPSFQGLSVGQVTILHNDPQQPPIIVDVRGSGILPEIDLSATSHNFGDVGVGGSVTWILAVSNLGTGSLVITNISSDHGDFSVDPTSLTVPPAGSQNVTVIFAPSTEGPVSGNLTIHSNDPDESHLQVSLSGSGVMPDAVLRVRSGAGAPGSEDNPVRIDLDNDVPVYGMEFNLTYNPEMLIPTNVERTIRSSGLSVFEWNESEPGTVYVVVLDISQSIRSGTGTVFNFYFDVAGDAAFGNVPLRLSDLLMVDEDGALLNTASVDSFFTVLAAEAEIEVSETFHDFGTVDVGNSSQWILTIFNVGMTNLVVSSISSDRADFSVDPTSFTIGPSGNRDVTVTFAPLSGGALSGELTVASNDGDEPSIMISLSGEGCGLPDIDVHPIPWGYGAVDIGSSSDKIFTVSNTGCQDLEVTGTNIVGAHTDQFSIVKWRGQFRSEFRADASGDGAV